ncbi:uncharacterized protein LOC124160481 [Ischnura elegans]|uniref:uncharacterized protein LOC124160481 n=1 Tax=Ischnura elegans TaxID=197161 RepID=UPI001ED89891|nr:uncharacterized protein LOC124160481 [Ischnura elegans]
MDNLRARHKGRFAIAKKAKRFENLKICSGREKSEVSGANDIIVEGSRIVDVMFLAPQLICSGCDNVLSLLDIQSQSNLWSLALPLAGDETSIEGENAACKACSYSNVDHDCRKNWSGSAKAMEADLALELLTTSTPLKAAQVKVGTIVCDEDSSTIAKIRRDVGNVEKVSDINHAKKNLGNALYGLRMTHKQLTPTPGNESFNAIVASKAPKSRHYGSSESNDYRVAAVVCQKNVGVGYVADVKKSLMLSPGSNTNKHRQWLARMRMAVIEKKKSLGFKRRRLFKSLKLGAIVKSREAREGETYRSGMGMDGDATHISPQVLVPVTSEYSLIIFDVETTGLCNLSDIIQVGAVGESEFSVYIKPSGPIPEQVSELTGLSVRDGEMWRGGKKLVHHSAVEGLKAFIQFLSKSERGALLVGHNVNFDARMIVAAIQRANLLEDFMSVVVGFADSCPIFKKLLPGIQSYRQECLFKDIIGESVSLDPHNALSDSLALKMLMSHMDINNEHIIKESFWGKESLYCSVCLCSGIWGYPNIWLEGLRMKDSALGA